MVLAFAVSYPMSATAQHYVKVVRDTYRLNEVHNASVLPTEIDSAKVARYIRIIEQSSTQKLREGGVVNGAKFLVTKYDNDIKKVNFTDSLGKKERSGCFTSAEILVKIGDEYLPANDVEYINAEYVKRKSQEIENNIKSMCVYNAEKKKLDLTKCKYEYIYNGTHYKPDTQPNIDSDVKFEFLTAVAGIPNITIKAGDFDPIRREDKTVKDAEQLWSWFVDNWILSVSIIIVILLVIAVFLWIRNNKKTDSNIDNYFEFEKENRCTSNSQKENSQHNKKSKHDKGVHIPQNVISNDRTQVTTEEKIVTVIDEKLHKSIDGVLTLVTSNQEILNSQTDLLNDIKVLASNTKEKELLIQKSQELEVEKGERVKIVAELDEANASIKTLESEIAQLRSESQIDGTIQVHDYSTFVSFAKSVLAECVEAENIAMKYWGSIKSTEQQKLNYFVSKFHSAKPKVHFSKWNGLLATLDLNGYVKDEEYVKYMALISDKEKIPFLSKRFFEEVLRPYVGAVILFLEQIRTAPKIGVKAVCQDNVEGLISSICTRCLEQGVNIDYRKLYEKVSEYDSLEIDEKVPVAITNIISNIKEEEILLYVDRYAVNLKSGDLMEKTRCFIKI